MKNWSFLKALTLTFVLFSCNSPHQSKKVPGITDTTLKEAKNYFKDCHDLYARAKEMDSVLLSQNEIDLPSANKAIKAFTDFSYYCRNDSLAPVYLIKTAQVARAVSNIPQAKTVLDMCIGDYPSFRDRPAALFLLAQLYDEPTYLNDEREAGRLYQKIIDEYPKSEWAASSKGAIHFIGKTDEDILKELKKKK